MQGHNMNFSVEDSKRNMKNSEKEGVKSQEHWIKSK